MCVSIIARSSCHKEETMIYDDELRSLDGHSSVSKDFRVYSLQGAVLSVVAVVQWVGGASEDGFRLLL
jgi:hypothetical protein